MEKLLTVDEVAEYIRLNRETVLRKARKGEIPAIKMGYRSYRFYKDQIDNWLKGKATAETEEVRAKSGEVKGISLKTFSGIGIIGGLSRRDIYEGR
ncbi:MAG: excisionase family DNA-binding protein [Dehalococcoidales bacterium]|nr:excisionase family DNA-binding protein [Dehalococcoidales bacterium]